MRQLELTVEKISHASDEHNARAAKLEREKSMLDARVKELEVNLRQISESTSTTTPGRRGIPATKPRSSSLSGFRITTLEQDLAEVRDTLAKKETDLGVVTQKLAQTQQELMKVENDKVAMEKKWRVQLDEVKGALDDKEEELVYLREQQGDGSREEELLKRIEEDDAKIAALELMVRNAENPKESREMVQKLNLELEEERRRVADLEEHHIELIREKEEALDELDKAQEESRALVKKLQDRKDREKGVKERYVHLSLLSNCIYRLCLGLGNLWQPVRIPSWTMMNV